MAYDSEYENHKSYYGQGHDEYNFPVDIMDASSDLLDLIKQSKECEEGIENGAVLLITEKQYIMAYNRGMGNGPHDATIARLYADITDQAELGFLSIMKYCHKAEDTLIHARIYSEKETKMSQVNKIFSFSGKREKKITQKEFNSFMDFYNEYAWAIKRENFKVSFAGKTMTIDDIKMLLESMIDRDFELSSIFTDNEIIVGNETNVEDKNITR